MANLRSCVYVGQVTHERVQPFRHLLRYKVFALFLDLDELTILDRGKIWFGYNRFALLGFRDRDHGNRDGTNTLAWIRDELKKAGLTDAGEQISVLCFPCVLGYVFNPLSVYFCCDASGRLSAILYEVKNTFGEQHSYLFPVSQTDSRNVKHACAKEFYVSPFIDMTATYEFDVMPPDERFSLFIRQSVPTGELLRAHWNGSRVSWSKAALSKCFWQYPLLTVKIIYGIHWQALKIWLKGAKFHRRPQPPQHDVSVIK